MNDAPLFSDLLVSRVPAARPPRRPATAIALAAALHLAVLGSVVLAPFIVLEVMVPPKANPSEVTFLLPSRPRTVGDGLPAAAIRHGTRGGRRRPAPPADRRRLDSPARPETQPATVPVVPPEPNPVSHDAPAVTGPTVTEGPAAGPPGMPGDPEGEPDGPYGPPGGCKGCTGTGEPDGPWGPFGPDVLGPAAPGVVQPVLISASGALPTYPDAARRARVEGVVVLMIVILADGSVGEIDVIRAPDPLWGFDLAAIQAVKHWRYRPALMHGRPVAVYAHVVVEFILSR